jgi:hypothetical protein
LAKDQPAEITIVQISEVQESPAFNGRLSFLTLRHLCQHWHSLASMGKQAVPAFVPALAKPGFNGAATVSADSHLAFMRWASQKTVYIPCMSPRNHADCTAILIITSAACWHGSG